MSPDPAPAPPVTEGRRRLVMLALATGGFAIGTTEFATMSLLPDMAAGLQVDAPTAGHVISVYALGVVIGAPVLAVATARMSRRVLLIALMAMFTLGNTLSAFAPSYPAMIAARFFSGLPHGAYFGTASLVAAGLVGDDRRTSAVAQIMLGLTIATVVGVPLANALGQAVGWRWCFGVVAGLGLLTLVLLVAFAPRDPPVPGASPLTELAALRSGRVWITLAIGAIGFGGLFAVYTYLASTLVAVTRVQPSTIPYVLAVFGIGMTAGNLVVPRFADRALMPTAGGLLLLSAGALAVFPWAAGHLWAIAGDVFVIGIGGALASVLQTRLMDVAGRAQALAAALNHAAFNSANAIGPWAGGIAIAAGLGWTATGWVGCGLALAGFAIWGMAMGMERRRQR